MRKRRYEVINGETLRTLKTTDKIEDALETFMQALSYTKKNEWYEVIRIEYEEQDNGDEELISYDVLYNSLQEE